MDNQNRLFIGLVALAIWWFLAALAMAQPQTDPAPPEVATAADATCRIFCRDNPSSGVGGSGCYFVAGDGGLYVLTAAHVVMNGNRPYGRIELEWWDQSKATGTVVGVDPVADIALVRLHSTPGVDAAKVFKGSLSVGDRVFYVGYALGRDLKSITGKVKDRWVNSTVLDRGSISGMSGGPIFTEQGLLAGAISATDNLQMPRETYFGHPEHVQRLIREKTGELVRQEWPARPFPNSPRLPGGTAPGGT